MENRGRVLLRLQSERVVREQQDGQVSCVGGGGGGWRSNGARVLVDDARNSVGMMMIVMKVLLRVEVVVRLVQVQKPVEEEEEEYGTTGVVSQVQRRVLKRRTGRLSTSPYFRDRPGNGDADAAEDGTPAV